MKNMAIETTLNQGRLVHVVCLIGLLWIGKFAFVTFSTKILEGADSIALRGILWDLSQCEGNRVLKRLPLVNEGFENANIRVCISSFERIAFIH